MSTLIQIEGEQGQTEDLSLYGRGGNIMAIGVYDRESNDRILFAAVGDRHKEILLGLQKLGHVYEIECLKGGERINYQLEEDSASYRVKFFRANNTQSTLLTANFPLPPASFIRPSTLEIGR